MDDSGDRAVLMASEASGGPDYYLYDFEQQSLNHLANSPREIAMIESHPSRIHVELVEQKKIIPNAILGAYK